MVTISTRVRRHAQVLAIAERFPNVTCSVGTHPHHAHEELDITADDLIARASHPKVVAIGEAGLDYHYDNSPRDAQAQGFRTHIAAARAAKLPLVIHTREADEDTARILEEEMGKGPFSAVLHCYTGGAELARRAVALGCSYRLHRHRDLQELGRPARHRQGPAGGPLPDRDRRAVPRADAVSRQAQRAGLRGRGRQDAGRGARRLVRGDRRGRPRRISSNCSQRCRAPQRPPHESDVHDPRLRLVRRRAAARHRLGRLRSEQSEEPAAALLAAGRAPARAGRHPRADRHRAGPARAASRRRRELARRRALHPRARRPHPRHRRPARAGPAQAPPRRRLRRRRDLAHADDALYLLLRPVGRQRLSADPEHA